MARSRIAQFGFCMALACASPALAAQLPLGLTIAIQPWTPATNDDTVNVLYNRDTVLSDKLDQTWQTYWPQIHDLLVSALETPSLLGKGFSLANVAGLQIDQPIVRLDALHGSGVAGDPYRIDVAIDLAGSIGKVSILTPEGVPGWLDPDAGLSMSATIHLTAGIQNTAGTAVFSDQTDPSAAALVEITSVSVTGKNIVGELIDHGADLLGVKDRLLKMVTDPNGPIQNKINAVARQYFAQALAQVDDEIAPYQTSHIDLLAVRAFLAPGAQKIVLALAPRAPLPDPFAGQGSIHGMLRATGNGTVSCNAIHVGVQRRTGPKPVLNPALTLGDAPVEPLAASFSCATPTIAPGQATAYTISGLSPDFPNVITYASPTIDCRGENPQALMVMPTGAAANARGDAVLPQDLATPNDLSASWSRVPCTIDAQVRERTDLKRQIEESREWNRDILVQPADQRVAPATQIDPAILKSGVTARPLAVDPARAAHEATMLKALNPQPLPPAPRSDIGARITNSNNLKALNPQPLPPAPRSDIGARITNSNNLKALNPQPLPPAPRSDIRARITNSNNLKALNPQPLPPDPKPDEQVH